MALEIDFYPSITETYKRIRNRLDGVYDKTAAGMPKKSSVIIKGTGSTVGASVRIYEDYTEKTIGYVQANSSGEFYWGFSPSGYTFYALRAVDTATSETSNTLTIRQYNLHNFLYLASEQCVTALSNIGQIKQDIFIQPAVGDTIEPTFPTEVDEYSTSVASLKDKITFPFLPFSYFNAASDKEDMVEACVWASERGGVFSSIFLLDELFSGIGVDSVFVSLWSDFKWWDLDDLHIPYISDNLEITVPALRKKRYPTDWHYISGSTDKTVDLTSVEASGTNYVWVYVDGDEDVDNTLTVKTSASQPFPINQTLTRKIQAIDVQQDDEEGTVTDIPYQLYVELEIPFLTMEKGDSLVSVYEGTGAGAEQIDNSDCTIISREILAIGQCNIDNDIYVTYNAYYEPFIICGVKFDENRHANELVRVFHYPETFRVWDEEDLDTVVVYVRFSDWKNVTGGEIDSVRSVLRALLPVTSQFILMVSFLSEDEDTTEFSISWPNFYKGFAVAEFVKPMSPEDTILTALATGLF